MLMVYVLGVLLVIVVGEVIEVVVWLRYKREIKRLEEKVDWVDSWGNKADKRVVAMMQYLGVEYTPAPSPAERIEVKNMFDTGFGMVVKIKKERRKTRRKKAAFNPTLLRDTESVPGNPLLFRKKTQSGPVEDIK